MNALINCPACSNELQVPQELMGQLVRCPLCERTFTAPSQVEEAEPAPAPPRQPPPPAVPRQIPVRRGLRCPSCAGEEMPVTRDQISLAGWIVFGVLLAGACPPLCWIGLLMKEEYQACARCGKKLAGHSI